MNYSFLFPLLLFFAAYKNYDIYTATAVLMAATVVQIGFVWWKERQLATTHRVTLVLVLLFGSLTLIFHDEMFIKWKPTILYWVMALAMLVTALMGKKTLIERGMGEAFQEMLEPGQSLDPKVWQHVNAAWIVFFAALGAVNIYIAYHFSDSVWVNFKVFGAMGACIAFTIGQTLYLMRAAGQLGGHKAITTSESESDIAGDK